MGEQVKEDKMVTSLDNLKILTKIQNLTRKKILNKFSALERLKEKAKKEKENDLLNKI